MPNRLIKYDAEIIRSLWSAGVRQAEICGKTGISPGSFWRIRSTLGLPPRECDRTIDYTEATAPTESEIIERAAAIRAGWSPEEHARRGGNLMQPPARIASYAFCDTIRAYGGVAD